MRQTSRMSPWGRVAKIKYQSFSRLFGACRRKLLNIQSNMALDIASIQAYNFGLNLSTYYAALVVSLKAIHGFKPYLSNSIHAQKPMSFGVALTYNIQPCSQGHLRLFESGAGWPWERGWIG